MLHTRIRKAREEMGYTREQFAELLEVSVSYMAEVERGRTGVSVKMLVKICSLLGLSADYVLFGDSIDEEKSLFNKIKRIDKKYMPLLNSFVKELLILEK